MAIDPHDNPTMAFADPPTLTLRPLGAKWVKDFAFHSVGLPMSVVGFTAWVVGVSVSLGLLIVWIGLLTALISFYAYRWFCRIERRRAALVLGEAIPEHYRRPPAGSSGWMDRLKAATKDPATWKDFAWTGICGVLGFVISMLALTAWGIAATLISLPLWFWAVPEPVSVGVEIDTLPLALGAMLLGVALIPVAGWVVRGLTVAELAMMVPLLRPNREKQLADRVEVLTETRAGAINAQAAELQRIERDLHDGAQARLVALALNLGMAEDKFDTDPEQARELLAEARGEARTALVELRDLARGIHPPILSDRGLEAAITALAARSPLAVTIEADVPDRLPPAVEAAAYFVVAEALANATKHSRALRVLVRLQRRGDVLVVEVADDGVGGADPQGAGIVGLQRRVAALDGELVVVSPKSSGTTLHAEVPCAE